MFAVECVLALPMRVVEPAQGAPANQSAVPGVPPHECVRVLIGPTRSNSCQHLAVASPAFCVKASMCKQITITRPSHSTPEHSAAMAPKAEKKPAKKVAKTATTGSKKKAKAKVESFKIYIYKVLKQVRHGGLLCLSA